MQYYCLQHQNLLSPLDASTTECCFHFGPETSLFLELLVVALCSSPVTYWTPSDLGWGWGSPFRIISFFLFMLSMMFLWQEYWHCLPFCPPVDHILTELFTMSWVTLLTSWVTLLSMAHRFIELHKPVHHNKAMWVIDDLKNVKIYSLHRKFDENFYYEFSENSFCDY